MNGELVKAIKKKYPKVKIIGASKLQSVEKIKTLFNAGVDAFGENYAQEFLEKKEKLPGIKWHFIGPLQTNKIKLIVGEVDVIHTRAVERIASRVAEGVEGRRGETGRVEPVLDRAVR